MLGKELDAASIEKAYSKFRNQGGITGNTKDNSSIIEGEPVIVPIDTDTSKEVTKKVDPEKLIPVVKKKTRKLTQEEMVVMITNQKALIKKMKEEGRNGKKIAFQENHLRVYEGALKKMKLEAGELTDEQKIIRDSGHYKGTSTFSATTTTRTSGLSLSKDNTVVEVPMPIINNSGSSVPIVVGGGEEGGTSAPSSGSDLVAMLHTANSHFT